MVGGWSVKAVCRVQHEEAAVREEKGHVAERIHEEEHGSKEEGGHAWTGALRIVWKANVYKPCGTGRTDGSRVVALISEAYL